MFYIVDAVLTELDFQNIHQELVNIAFEDGLATAGADAKKVKKNLQSSDFKGSTVHRFVRQRIRQNERFTLITAPLRISDLLLSKYEIGMEYGWHIDNPLMQSGTIRYNSHRSGHRGSAVRATQQFAIIRWVQSMIRDPRHRTIL